MECPERSAERRGGDPVCEYDGSMMAGGATFKELTPADARPGRPHGSTTNSTAAETGSGALAGGAVDVSFPPVAPINFPSGISDSSAPINVVAGRMMPYMRPGSIPADRDGKGVRGMQLFEMGGILGESLRSVSSLCSQSTGRGSREEVHVKQTSTFPLPTDRELILQVIPEDHAWTVEWLRCMCMALNSFWGCPDQTLQEQPSGDQRRSATKMQARILRGLMEDVTRLKEVEEVTETFDWGDFFRTRGIDHKGDEVKIALGFCWKNIAPALPKEIGVANLVDICEQGCKHYIENFPSYLKAPHEWGPLRKSRVMVKEDDWFEVADGRGFLVLSLSQRSLEWAGGYCSTGYSEWRRTKRRTESRYTALS